jgi:hypothetical protein
VSDSYKPILDREGVEDSMKQLHEPISLLKDLVDYGTSLIPRAFDSSPKDFKATYLLFVHLQQFVAHLDAAAELLSKGCCLSANLQVRSLLENYMMLTWIFKADTQKKIDHIFVANLRRRREWQSIAVPGSAEAAKHSDAATSLTLTPEQAAGIAAEIASIDRMLADPKYAAINLAFDQANPKKKHDRHWYELCGATSIRQVVVDLGRKKDYDYVYGPFSGVSHGGDISKSMLFRGDRVEVHPLREVQGVPLLSKLAATYAMDVYRQIIDEYRPGERDNFTRKYLEEWQARFKKEFKFDVQPEWTII